MTETDSSASKSKKAAGQKTKARKAARKAVTKTPRKVETSSTVYPFTPRAGRPALTMETFMTQKKNQYDKIASDAASAQKEHMDALMQSGKIVSEGMEDILKTCMSYAQTAAEKNAQAFKALIGCKTLNEFTEAHNRVAQSNFDDFMSSATKLSELAVKVATDAFEPINDQMTRSMKFATDAMAA